ncbi:AraC family transcriptional regulator [Paenibacillus wulumuqiensis]|uniref:AraC family transcriptional regulator n=1 Tax=Paenibacillus wulumuqiensis TaxID=1567107 RepID=UPI000619AC42|nr:helix-turn-helix domain-containing protein [Paenibacillus wulumuqiensis]
MRAFHENRLYYYETGFPFQAIQIRNINFLAHWHHDLEFMYVYEGSVRMGINSETRVLHQGEMALCGSGDIHYYDSTGLESSILLIIFNPRLIGSPAGWPQEHPLRSSFVSPHGPDGEQNRLFLQQAEPVIRSLAAEVQHHESQYEMIITGLLHQLSGLALRYLAADHSSVRRHHSRTLAHLKVMQELLEHLEQHCTEPCTLQDGADYAGMSVFHFSRFFKTVTGVGYNTYINELRIRHAEQLILQSDRKLIDIALESGFGNVRTFNRVFRQLRGRTPSDLR